MISDNIITAIPSSNSTVKSHSQAHKGHSKAKRDCSTVIASKIHRFQLISSQTKDMNQGKAHCLALQAQTLDL
jgi:stress-induced morphogen